MSLIDDTTEEINRYCFEQTVKEILWRNWEQHKETTAYLVDTIKIKSILEKHLKQSENKSIDDLIEKYKRDLKMYNNIPHHRNERERFLKDLETLKQSEKVVEIKKHIWVYENWDKYIYCDCPCWKMVLGGFDKYCSRCGIKIKWID